VIEHSGKYFSFVDPAVYFITRIGKFDPVLHFRKTLFFSDEGRNSRVPPDTPQLAGKACNGGSYTPAGVL